jgi:hypothetical protein
MNDKGVKYGRAKYGHTLHIWTVYDHPRDYPDSYVARLTLVGAGVTQPSNVMFTADTLEELRSLLPPGMTYFPRDEQDDPVILEVWI